jgi:hypothetical protein
MRSIAAGKKYRMPSTIDAPSCLGEVAMALEMIGYPVDTVVKSGRLSVNKGKIFCGDIFSLPCVFFFEGVS